MPKAEKLKIEVTPQGLVGTWPDGTSVAVGVLRDGASTLLFRMFL